MGVPLRRVIIGDSDHVSTLAYRPPHILQGPRLCDGYHMCVGMGYITGASISEENIITY